jgi:hypothetical protein
MLSPFVAGKKHLPREVEMVRCAVCSSVMTKENSTKHACKTPSAKQELRRLKGKRKGAV